MYKFIPVVNHKVNQILAPVLKGIDRLGITPNQLSISGFVLGTVSVVFVLMQKINLAVIFLSLAMALDLLDGSLARYAKLESKLGERLELVFDRTNEIMWFLALVVVGLVSLKMAFLAVIAILLMTNLRHKSNFDPGFKRVILLFGYLLNNFELALEIIFLANLFGFVVSLLILDYQYQKKIDNKSVVICT